MLSEPDRRQASAKDKNRTQGFPDESPEIFYAVYISVVDKKRWIMICCLRYNGGIKIYQERAKEAFDLLIASLKEQVEGNGRYSHWERHCANEALVEAQGIFTENMESLFGGEVLDDSAVSTLSALLESACNKGDPFDEGDILFDKILQKIKDAAPSLVEGLKS